MPNRFWPRSLCCPSFCCFWPVRQALAAQGGAWLPLIDGGQPDPPLTLFGATHRNAARTPRLAWSGSGLAAVTWSELERDARVEVSAGRFNLAALLTKHDGQ